MMPLQKINDIYQKIWKPALDYAKQKLIEHGVSENVINGIWGKIQNDPSNTTKDEFTFISNHDQLINSQSVKNDLLSLCDDLLNKIANELILIYPNVNFSDWRAISYIELSKIASQYPELLSEKEIGDETFYHQVVELSQQSSINDNNENMQIESSTEQSQAEGDDEQETEGRSFQFGR